MLDVVIKGARFHVCACAVSRGALFHVGGGRDENVIFNQNLISGLITGIQTTSATRPPIEYHESRSMHKLLILNYY